MPMYENEPWTAAAPAQISPIMMALMGMNTSGAGAGQLYDTGSQRWTDPSNGWGALGGGRVGPAGQSNYSGLPNPGNGNSASGFYTGPGAGSSAGFGPAGPPGPAGGLTGLDNIVSALRGRMGNTTNPRTTDPTDPSAIGQIGGDITGQGTGGLDGLTPATLGNGNIGTGTGGQPDFFSLLSQLHQMMQRPGTTQQPSAPTPNANGTVNAQTMPFRIPAGQDPNTYGAGYYAPNQVTPGSTTGNNPADEMSLQNVYDGGAGQYGLKSMSMGNRPGMRSPMGMTGGRFQRPSPGGYQGY